MISEDEYLPYMKKYVINLLSCSCDFCKYRGLEDNIMSTAEPASSFVSVLLIRKE